MNAVSEDKFVPGVFVKVDDYIKISTYGIIYAAYNTRTCKIYIGQTKLKLSDRRQRHFSARGKYKFLNALRKNKNEFVWTIIDCAYSSQELDEKEIFWIKQYKATEENIGYNLTSGGQGRSDYSFSKETNKRRAKSVEEHYTKKFYNDFPVEEILNFLKEENNTLSDCFKYYGISQGKLFNFLKKNYNTFFEECLEKEEKLRHKRVSQTNKGKLRLDRRIPIDIPYVVTSLNMGKTFPELSKELNINTDTVRKRIKEYDPIFYKTIITDLIQKRNLKNSLSKVQKYKAG